MSAIKPLLDDFHDALLTGDAEKVLPAIRPHPRLSYQRQMAIYIDGYRIRLTQAIRTDYPALLALLGDKEFGRLALLYIENHPPAHFNLDRYPHGFAAFLPTVSDDAFAGELARLEAAIAQVFMQEESRALTPEALAGITPELFGSLTLVPRCAATLLAFTYPVNDWLLAQRNGTMQPRPEKEESYLYLWRHKNEVQRVALEPAAYGLLEQLAKGLPVAAALDAAMGERPEHAEAIAANLHDWFGQWVAAGFFKEQNR